jgi:hypothetical protein
LQKIVDFYTFFDDFFEVEQAAKLAENPSHSLSFSTDARLENLGSFCEINISQHKLGPQQLFLGTPQLSVVFLYRRIPAAERDSIYERSGLFAGC